MVNVLFSFLFSHFLGRDLTGAQNLSKKHQALMVRIKETCMSNIQILFFFEKLLSLLQREKSSKASRQKQQMIVSKKILAVSFPCGTVFDSTCINSLLQTEIAGHEPRIRAVCDNGVQMIDNGRYQENEF